MALDVVIGEYLEKYSKSFDVNISSLDLGGIIGRNQMDRPAVIGPQNAEDIHAVLGEDNIAVTNLLRGNPNLDPQVVYGILDTIADAVASDPRVESLLQRASENPNADTVFKHSGRDARDSLSA